MPKLPRPHMPVSVQRDACLILLGFKPGEVEWDHDPALGLRELDQETGTYTPDANDPHFIRPRENADHGEKTKGDVKRIARRRKSARKLEEKVCLQESRLQAGKELIKKINSGEQVPKTMRPTEKRKQKIPSKPMGSKNEGGQHTASTPGTKTARRFP